MLKTGDVGFVIDRNSKLSKTIAWFMKSRWSHSFIVLGEFKGETLIAETSNFEVMISTLSRYESDPMCSMEIYSQSSLSDEDRETSVVESEKILKTTRYPVPLYGLTKCKSSSLFGIDPESIDTEELYVLCKQSMVLVHSKD
jgi:hypothetical protein